MKSKNLVATHVQSSFRASQEKDGSLARLKGMGAVYLQGGVCLLPKTDDHVRRLKMLENEIADMGGESVILETVALDRLQEDKVNC